MALYEKQTPFEPVLVDLGDEASRATFHKLWPIGQFPVLEDVARGWMVPESSIIIEYLDQHYPGRTRLMPADPDVARQVRMRDRYFDLHVHVQMQKIVGDRIRPAGQRDAFGVAQARAQMRTALELVESDIGNHWIMGDMLTMADCAAAPALNYADKVAPLLPDFPKTTAYLQRLRERPSFARVLKEAEPYANMFPAES